MVKFSVYLNRQVLVGNLLDSLSYVGEFCFYMFLLRKRSVRFAFPVVPSVLAFQDRPDEMSTPKYLIAKTRLFKCKEKFLFQNFKIIRLKTVIFFHISAQNIDCGYSLEPPRLWYSLEPPRRGGSNEYPQYMFLSRNKKNNVYTRKPKFYYTKVGFTGVKII